LKKRWRNQKPAPLRDKRNEPPGKVSGRRKVKVKNNFAFLLFTFLSRSAAKFSKPEFALKLDIF
jgi:hypothetical protein